MENSSRPLLARNPFMQNDLIVICGDRSACCAACRGLRGFFLGLGSCPRGRTFWRPAKGVDAQHHAAAYFVGLQAIPFPQVVRTHAEAVGDSQKWNRLKANKV